MVVVVVVVVVVVLALVLAPFFFRGIFVFCSWCYWCWGGGDLVAGAGATDADPAAAGGGVLSPIAPGSAPCS
jgi:hypothetical protein